MGIRRWVAVVMLMPRYSTDEFCPAFIRISGLLSLLLRLSHHRLGWRNILTFQTQGLRFERQGFLSNSELIEQLNRYFCSELKTVCYFSLAEYIGN